MHLRACSVPALERQSLAAPNTRSSSTCQAFPMQIAEVAASEFAEITGYATVMFAITLVVSLLTVWELLEPDAEVGVRRILHGVHHM